MGACGGRKCVRVSIDKFVIKTAAENIQMSLLDSSFPSGSPESVVQRTSGHMGESSRHFQHAQVSISSDEDLLDIQHTGTTDESMNGGYHGASKVGQAGDNGSSPDESGNYHAGAEPDIPGLGQYDDFHTIDWQRDIARDRMRHRHIVKKKKESVCDLIRGAHDAWSGWVCVLLVRLLHFKYNFHVSNPNPS